MASRTTRGSITAAFLFAFALAILFTQIAGHAQPGEPLPYSTGYLVTGDYVVGSVDITSASGSSATATIPLSGVPPDADIIAAFLYWETIAPSWATAQQIADFVKFRGQPIKSVRVKSKGQPLTGSTAACFSASGALTMTMFRADVLRLLPRQTDKDGKPTGKLLVNDSDLDAASFARHTVTLPEAGTGNVTPQSAGATLVVVYRDTTPGVPLRKIVVHDGLYIQKQGETTTQNLRGFYQSSPLKHAKLTQIVGSGAKNPSDQLTVTGSTTKKWLDPFPSSSKSSDRSWTAFSADITSVMPGTDVAGPYGEKVVSTVSHTKNAPYDCLAWAGTWLSTNVLDNEHDGVPDRLEQSSPAVLDPDGVALPDLYAVGARTTQKDLLVELNALYTTTAKTHGSADAPYDSGLGPDHTPGTVDDKPFVQEVNVPPHNHMPTAEVLKMLGKAYEDKGVIPHFDVGDIATYHGLGADYAASVGTSDKYLVPTGVARGGELDLEQACDPADATCRFPDFPGVIGWGFSLLKHMFGTDRDPTGGSPRFDEKREGLFHYVMYAHYRGKPRALPCLDAFGRPAPYDGAAPNTCAIAANPTFANDPRDLSVPSGVSGAADLPGYKALVTLGRWEDFVGKPLVRASTTLHELGHNLWLWHGGGPAKVVPVAGGKVEKIVEPNCKPNYLSVMSYLFQTSGLLDINKIEHIALSDRENATLTEPSLKDGSIVADEGGSLPFRAAWFVPLGMGGLVDSLPSFPAATKFCSGQPFPTGVPAPNMARVDAIDTFLGDPLKLDLLDWATNGFAAGENAAGQDINFDNQPNTALTGFDDWTNLRLDLMGSGHVMGGAISNGGEDFGGEDFGGEDFGGEDFGGEDFGGEDFGGEDFGGEDFGGVDVDGSAFGSSDFGGEDFGGSGDVEITHDDATALAGGGGRPPRAFNACVIGPIGSETAADAEARCPGGPSPLHRIRLSWEEPNIGTVFAGTRPDGTGLDGYEIYRYRVNTADNSILLATETAVCGTPTTPTCGTPAEEMTFDEPQELPDGATFRYFANTVFVDNDTNPSNPLPRSGPSDATVTAVNAAPVASADGPIIGNEDTVIPINVLANDADVDSPLLGPDGRGPLVVAGPANGTLVANPDGSFTYAPNLNFYGDDSFTYYLRAGTFSDSLASIAMSADSSPPVLVNITVNPVNDVPAFNRGPDDTVLEDSGARAVLNWATPSGAPYAGFAGPANEIGSSCDPLPATVCSQLVDFIVSNSTPSLFTATGQPAIDADGRLTYTPAPNANGTALVTVGLHDNGGTANGGSDTSAPQTFNIIVIPVNDPPVAGSDSYTTYEDASLTVSPVDGVLAGDAPGPPAPAGTLDDESDQLLEVALELASAPAHGNVTMNADGSFTYTPDANYNGPDSFRYVVWDKGAHNTGDDPRSAEGSVALTVAPVNDAPVGGDHLVTMFQGTVAVFAAGDFGFTDPSDALGGAATNNFSRVKITTGPSAGTLMNGDTPLAAGDFVTVADIDAGKLTFTPAANVSGLPYASFTFQVEDDGGTANGGVDLDPTPNTMTINVWVATTSADCVAVEGNPPETPEIGLDGNMIVMGVPGGDTALNRCIHGASALLPPLTGTNTKYRVTFSYNLFTWDAYNEPGTPGFTGTGYWDSFSVSISKQPYAVLTLSDPLTTGQSNGDLLGFWLWGGNDYADGKLECLPSTDFPSNFGCTSVPPGQVEVHISGTVGEANYLNVVLDTKTEPQANHAHRSFGGITILNIVQAVD